MTWPELEPIKGQWRFGVLDKSIEMAEARHTEVMLTLGFTPPVSYTHLDVYKRQLWIIPLYSWRGAAWSSIASDSLLVVGVGATAFLLSRRSRAIVVNASANALV